jgi:hypothetical protein
VERGERASTKDVVRFVEEFADKVAESSSKGARTRGVLLLVDEAGKALEYAAHHPDRGDVQLLQELAEAAARSGDRPLVVGVLLHQAFDQYASRLGVAQRNEWAKVQGRFEDVPFQEQADQVLRLIAMAIGLRGLGGKGRLEAEKLVDELVSSVGPPGMPDKGKLARVLMDTFPLHPVTALLLGPLFRSQISQNERSLFAFLSSTEPGALQEFLPTAVVGNQGLETYGPDRLYRYIGATLGERLYRHGGRQWAVINDALARLPKNAREIDARVLMTVGLLGMLGDSSGIPASEVVVQLSLAGTSAAERTHVSEALQRLRSASILVFRRFRNAYQIWDGSDLDLDERVRSAGSQIDPRAGLVDCLNRAVPPRPIVARRHLFETGTLRYFELRYGDESMLDGDWAALDTEADGVAWVVVPSSDAATSKLKKRLNQPGTWLGVGEGSKPVVVCVFNEAGRLREVAAELAAMEWVRTHTPELDGDPIARKELAGRILDAEDALRREVAGLFNGERDSAWYYRGIVKPVADARQLGAELSGIFDEVYDKAPRVLNELLNRSQLSSAAAAARRELLLGMVSRRSQANLGIEGYPPELSMYRSVLEQHGLHREVRGRWQFVLPRSSQSGSIVPAIRKVESILGREGARVALEDVYAILRRPPFGVKAGLIPVVVLFVLLTREAEVALYEEGAFVPTLDAPVIERLLRAPSRFHLQRFAIEGAREEVFTELTGNDEAAAEGPLLLVRQFVRVVQELPPFTRNTRELSATATQVRDAIVRAKEPGALVFTDLPKACGYEPLSAKRTRHLPEGLGAALQGALKELRSAYPGLLDRIRDALSKGLGIPGSGDAMREELVARAKRMRGVASDAQLKTFLVRAGDSSLDLTGWTVSVATFLAGRPPESWNDGDVQRMSVNLAMIARRFSALEAAFLEHEKAGLPEGAVAVRISVTEAGREEAERVVLIREDERRKVDAIATRVRQAVDAERGDSANETVVAGLAQIIRDLLGEMVYEPMEAKVDE